MKMHIVLYCIVLYFFALTRRTSFSYCFRLDDIKKFHNKCASKNGGWRDYRKAQRFLMEHFIKIGIFII